MKPVHTPVVGDAYHQAMIAGRRAEGWGVKQECSSCGCASYTGTICTRCMVGYGSGSSSPENGSQPVFTPRAAEESAERKELEAPEFVCGTLCMHEVPRPVRDLCALAERHGWTYREMHSRGRPVGANGKQLAVAEMWSVRFRRDGYAGYAVRRGAAWSSVWVAGVSLPPFGKLGVTLLGEWLAAPNRPASWYADVVAGKAASALAAKVVACPGRGKCAWVDEDLGLHTHRGNGDVKPKKAGEVEHGG